MRRACIPKEHDMSPRQHLPCKNTSTTIVYVISISIISGISGDDCLEGRWLSDSYLETIKSSPAFPIHTLNKQHLFQWRWKGIGC